jgi:hypothetical protein
LIVAGSCSNTAQLTKRSTDNQQAPTGSTLINMEVGVLDQYGNNLGCIQVSAVFCVGGREAQVAFTPSPGGQVSQTEITTNRGIGAVDWTIRSGANTLTVEVGSLSVVCSANGL